MFQQSKELQKEKVTGARKGSGLARMKDRASEKGARSCPKAVASPRRLLAMTHSRPHSWGKTIFGHETLALCLG
jgi:hypothetical protein